MCVILQQKSFLKRKVLKKRGLETSSRAFCVYQELSVISMENEIFETNCQNIAESGWKKYLELHSFRSVFRVEFFDKSFSFVIVHKLAKFHY